MQALWVAALILGDLIVLKDGRTLEGAYAGEDEHSVRYRDASGRTHVQPKANVLRVDRAPTKTNLYENIASALGGEGPKDYFYLCAWAEEQGLVPHVDKLCRIAVADEDVRGRAFFRLSKVAAGEEARTWLCRSVASDPTLTEAVDALGAAGEGVVLPSTFLLHFARALNEVLNGKHGDGLSDSKRALSELDKAQRRKAERSFKLETGMTMDKYLSRVEQLSKRKDVCPYCHGTGYVTCEKCGGKGWLVCPTCGGKGTRQTKFYHPYRGTVTKTQECPTCKGTGRVHCGLCLPLGVPEELIVIAPQGLQPGGPVPIGSPGGATPGVVVTGGRIRRPPPSSSWRVTGPVKTFVRKYSGKRPCPHCRGKKKAKPFTVDEMDKLGRCTRMWSSEAEKGPETWGAGTRMRSFAELYTERSVEPERSTAFYEGKWMTPAMRRAYLSARGEKKTEVDISRFETWKSGHRCRTAAEHAIDIPADPRAWRGLFALYSLSANSPARRFASSQVFHAAFRPGRGEASAVLRDGSLLAVAEPRLVVEPDRPTAAAGELELWFRVLEARKAPGAALAVTVLAVRRGGKTTGFF